MVRVASVASKDAHTRLVASAASIVTKGIMPLMLLILALLVLGGILSFLGDRLGSRVGKARLSLFNLRPRRTAVVITVLTGSLISALSLGLLLLVSRQLRVGLFELDALQERLRESRKNLDAAEAERQSARATIQRIEAEELEPLRKQNARATYRPP